MNRRCLTCGNLSPNTRCAPCTHAFNAPRRAKKAALYNPEYRATRAAYAAQIAAGAIFNCPRCHRPVGIDWQLDHTPYGTLEPAHTRCNESNKPEVSQVNTNPATSGKEGTTHNQEETT